MKLRERVADMARLSGGPLETLHVVGGGIQNEQLCQWIADATGLTVAAGPVETTSVGNALVQMRAAGVVETLADARNMSNSSFHLTHYTPSNGEAWMRPMPHTARWSPRECHRPEGVSRC